MLDAAKRVLLSGSLNPHFFIYPALQVYLTAAAAAIAYPFVLLAGCADGWAQYCMKEACLATAGRTVVALFGLGTVFVAYAVGKLMHSSGAGLAAAAFVAVCPYHALDTRYTNVDVPMAFWALATLCLAVSYARRQQPWRLWVGAATVGAAAATKYLGFLFVLPLAAAALAHPRPQSSSEVLRRTGLAIALVAAAAACFLTLAPYTLLDYASFAATMAHEARYGYQSQFGWDLSPRGLVYHKFAYQLLASLPFCLGFGIHVMALWGLACVWRRCRETRLVFAVAFACYFLLVGSLEHIFPRYLAPLLPMLCVAAGVGCAALTASPVRWRRAAAWLLSAAAIVHAGLMAVTMIWGMSPHVGRLAERWLAKHVPAGSTVAVSKFAKHAMPLPDVPFRLIPLAADHRWLSQERPDCIVVEGWTLMGLERAAEEHSAELRFFRTLGGAESSYRLAAVFDPKYFTEGLYARLDPQFRNHFESACIRIYVREAGGGAALWGLPPRLPRVARGSSGGARPARPAHARSRFVACAGRAARAPARLGVPARPPVVLGDCSSPNAPAFWPMTSDQ